MIKQLVSFLFPEKKEISGLQLLVISWLTVVIAQVLLIHAYKQPGFWDIQKWISNPLSASPLPGLIFYIIGGWLFIQGLTLVGHTPSQLNISTNIVQTSTPRFGFWITCLGLALILGYSVATPSFYSNGPVLEAIWLISIALLIASVFISINWRPPAFKTISQWIHAHRWELLGILVVVFTAFMIRVWNVELHPYAFMNDEGEMGNNAACIQFGECKNIFDIGWAGQPVLAFVPTLISISILGTTATAVRMASVIIGTLAVFAVYLFTKEVFGQKEAWLAAALLAVLPVHVHFSRLGVDNIIDSLSTTVVLGFLFFGIKRGSTLSFLAAGIIGGLCFYTYPGTRLAPILGVAAIGYVILKTRGALKAHIFNISIFIFSFIVTVAPIAGYFLANQNIFFTRMEAEGIFNNQAIDSGNISGILFSQFMKSSLVFILTSAPVNFFNSPRPYLTPLAAIFFILGLSYTIWRIKEERYFILFIWFWAEIIFGSTITGGPPTSQRMLMSAPALTIITAIGVCKITDNIPKTFKYTKHMQTFCLVIFIAWIGYKDISFYHYDYRVGHYFEDPTNEFTYETAPAISQLHTSGRLYLMVDPLDDYLSFANFNYFSPDVEKAYMNEVTPQSLASLPKDKDVLFIAIPKYLADLRKIASLLPAGQWDEVHRRYQPVYMLYYSYKIKKGDLQAFNP